MYKGTLGTSVVKVFDLDVASVGLNEKQLKAMGKEKGKDYETVLIVQKSHAGYYPGASSLILKMIFTKEGKIIKNDFYKGGKNLRRTNDRKRWCG